jgi:hypothetical protein
MGRATQGVKLIELQKRNDTLMFGCVVPKEEQEEATEAIEVVAEEPTIAEE